MWQAGVRGCAQYCSSHVCGLASGLDPLDLTSPAVSLCLLRAKRCTATTDLRRSGRYARDCGAFIAQTLGRGRGSQGFSEDSLPSLRLTTDII